MAHWTLVEGRLADGLPMRLYLGEHEGAVWSARLEDDEHRRNPDEFVWQLGKQIGWQHCAGCDAPEGLREAALQVGEYFAGRRLNFDLPLSLRGTPFQVRVWQQLMQISFGDTCSYGDIAEVIGYPAAFRAVGGANGRNSLPLFVPCHRVVAAGGKLGGFTGGLGLKRRLLAHESAVLSRPSTATRVA